MNSEALEVVLGSYLVVYRQNVFVGCPACKKISVWELADWPVSIFVVAMDTVIDNAMFAVHSMSTSFPSESDQAQEEEGEEARLSHACTHES